MPLAIDQCDIRVSVEAEDCVSVESMEKSRQRKTRARVARRAYNHAYTAATCGRFEKATFRPGDSLFAVALICGLGLMAWVATVLYGFLTKFL
jgi:hypothetical protein